MTRALLQAVHVLAWALCYGAITYTYFRMNPLMRRFTRTVDEYEASVAATLGGLHRWTFGTLALAGVTGAALALWAPGLPAGAESPAAALVAVKAALLPVMLAVQGYTSLVMWPRRARAGRAERPSEQRRFFRVAAVMGWLLLAQLVLGALAHGSTIDGHR